MDKTRIGAVLLMGGSGERFGGIVPKQFALLQDEKVYLHTLSRLLKQTWIEEIVLVCHPDWMDRVEEETASFKSVRVVKGGATRQISSYLGLLGFSLPPEIVLIHDAVRPFVSDAILEANRDMALQTGAVDTCIPSSDTLVFAPNGKTIDHIPDRSQFLRGQTPQTFRYDWILEAHQKAHEDGVTSATDDCFLMLRQGFPVSIVPGEEENIKITTPFDLVHMY